MIDLEYRLPVWPKLTHAALARFFATAELLVFTMQLRMHYCRISVCPSLKRVHCDKTKLFTAKIPIPHNRSIHLFF